MRIKANVKLTNWGAAAKQIRAAVVAEVKAIVASKTGPAEIRIRQLVIDAIESSPEFQSLADYSPGDLAPEFGFVNGLAIQQLLLTAIDRALTVRFDKSKIVSGRFFDLKFDKDQLLNSGVGEYMSKNNNIEWLRWLLEEGTTNVIYGYNIEYNLTPDQVRRSRSKTAIMEPGGYWHVPSNFAGTDADNFITRAINPALMAQIEKLIRGLFP